MHRRNDQWTDGLTWLTASAFSSTSLCRSTPGWRNWTVSKLAIHSNRAGCERGPTRRDGSLFGWVAIPTNEQLRAGRSLRRDLKTMEQSFGRPCRQCDCRFKRTYELTSSIVPRGTSFHRSVELECPSIRLDAARFLCCCCCCGLFSGPAELGAV